MSDDEIIEGEAVEETRHLPAVRTSEAIVARDEISVEELLGQRDKIVQAMERAMRKDVHYGTIPGISKPTLLKPGAELLNVLFRFAPSYHSERTWHDDGHLTVVSRCTLTHIPTSLVIGEGEGLCSTREAKYAYRQGGRICPECGQPAIIKGRAEYGGGWLCFTRKGGCNTKWADGTEQARLFETMDTGRTENPDIADSYNTVLKMADKRALVAAILNCTAASDVFTQDVEDSGGATETEASPQRQEQRPFDPETDLLPGAISGQGASARLFEALNGFDPTIDWTAVVAEVVQSKYGRNNAKELRGEQYTDFMRRLSNAVQWITDHTPAGDFPPAGEDVIVKGFVFAFAPVAFSVVYKEKAEAPLSPQQTAQIDAALAEEDDIPFGEGYGYEREE